MTLKALLLFGTFQLTVMTFEARAQDTLTNNARVKLSGYLETYYLFDLNKPDDNTLPDFLYSFNRHNEVNINLGLIKAAYSNHHVRANLALMAGTYTNANLASEPGVLKNIFEANAGIRLAREKDLWLDMGIFPSHIGFESAIGAETATLTRSMLAENSPYYEAGVKVTYHSSNERWILSALMLNGWQRIQRVDGNSLPSFGTQVTFMPSEYILFNSSTFIGTDTPDQFRQMRYFHNFFAELQLMENTSLIIGFDIGFQQKNKGGSSLDKWFSPILIVKQRLTKNSAIALRAEYYEDTKGVIIKTEDSSPFKTSGFSVNFDRQLLPNAMWRIEARLLHSKENIFQKSLTPSSSDVFLATSVAISF